MEQKLNERNSCINDIVALAEESDIIGAAITYGGDRTECSDVRIDLIPYEASGVAVAYKRLSYIISSELDVAGSRLLERSDDSCVKEYSLGSGVTLTLGITALEKVHADGWYNIRFDYMNAAATLSGAVDEDILYDPAAEQEAAAEPEPETAPEPEPEVIAAAVPVELPAEQEPELVPEEEETVETKDYLEYVSRSMKNAQRAIAAGQLIRASEIVAILRKIAIELICLRSGVEDNFEQAIDFIDCEEKNMLLKTYPRNIDQKNMVIALSTLSELFDRLI